MWRHLMGLIFFLALPPSVAADERGQPLISEYITMAMGAGPQNGDAIELPDHRIALANSAALMLFDGQRWRAYRHPEKKQKFNSLVLTPDGRIYSGVDNDIGYFAFSASGDAVWYSLLPALPATMRDFGPVLKVYYDSKRNKLWYLTNHRLFQIDPQNPSAAREVTSQGLLKRLYVVGDEIWLLEHDKGILRLNLDAANTVRALELMPAPGLDVGFSNLLAATAFGEMHVLFRSDARIFRWQSGKLIELTDNGLLAMSGDLPQNVLRMNDGRFAVKFKRRAPCLFDLDLARDALTLRYCLPETDGTAGNNMIGMMQDSQNGLWLSQLNMITRVDIASGLSSFGRATGISNTQDILRVDGRLFATNSTDLKRLVPGNNAASARFETPWPQVTPAYVLASIGKTLFVGGNGVYRIAPGADVVPEIIFQSATLGRITALRASTLHPDRLWIGGTDGVVELTGVTAGPVTARKATGLNADIRQIIEAGPDLLWAADGGGGLWQIHRSEAAIIAKSMHGTAGLPAGTIRFGDSTATIFFLTSVGVRAFDPATTTFVKPAGLPEPLLSEGVFSLMQDIEGNLWLRGGPGLTGVAMRTAGGWQLDLTPFTPADLTSSFIKFRREGNVVWATREALLRLDLDERKKLPQIVTPMLTQLSEPTTGLSYPIDQALSLSTTQRNLRFHFALPQHHRSQAIAYRSWLHGFDRNFSDWGERSDRDYTNLPDGPFNFEIQARDSFGRVSTMTAMPLDVTPPWFRSTLAYFSYLLGGLLALVMAAKLGAQRRQRVMLIQQHVLENTVQERTLELSNKNQQLAEQATRLEEVDRLKTRFFINVGHEFRTPLTLVLGPVDDLLRDVKERFSSKAREQLELVQRNAKRVLDLIVELLDVNRFEHGQLNLHVEPHELRALLSRVAEDARPLMTRYGHTLNLALPEAPVYAQVDVLHFERALSNLLSNAAKYMRRGGAVQLSLETSADQLVIKISDQGRGIAPLALAHVFDRFYQAEGSDQASGYGIGLALVSEIVQAHSGNITVDSREGEGTTFSITLALLNAAEQQRVATLPSDLQLDPSANLPTIDEHPAAAQTSLRVRVLVVDDHADMRARLRYLLATQYEVFEAEDGPSALLAIQQQLPDVVVCDVMMPGFDGVELCRRVRSDPDIASIGLLLLTAKVGSEYAVAGLNAGANDYLAKPFDASELLARVGAILAHAMRLRVAAAQRVRALPVSEAIAEPVQPINISDTKWLQRLDSTIALYFSEPSFDIEALANAMHSDRSTLFRRCKAIFDKAPGDYLREARLQHAHGLLVQGAASVTEIGYAVGFENLSSFTRAFKAHFNYAPSRAQRESQTHQSSVSMRAP